MLVRKLSSGLDNDGWVSQPSYVIYASLTTLCMHKKYASSSSGLALHYSAIWSIMVAHVPHRLAPFRPLHSRDSIVNCAHVAAAISHNPSGEHHPREPQIVGRPDHLRCIRISPRHPLMQNDLHALCPARVIWALRNQLRYGKMRYVHAPSSGLQSIPLNLLTPAANSKAT